MNSHDSNERLTTGERSQRLVKWLNSLTDVQQRLEAGWLPTKGGPGKAGANQAELRKIKVNQGNQGAKKLAALQGDLRPDVDTGQGAPAEEKEADLRCLKPL